MSKEDKKDIPLVEQEPTEEQLCAIEHEAEGAPDDWEPGDAHA